jgi:hypothetical protein
MQAGQEDGLSYRLYRISGDFKAHFDLHDYPFDTQQLRLHFQNTERRRELITYVIDRFGLRLDRRRKLAGRGRGLFRTSALAISRTELFR